MYCTDSIHLVSVGKVVSKYKEMESQLTKQSTEDHVIRFLQENGFEEDLIEVFKGKPNMQLLWPCTHSGHCLIYLSFLQKLTLLMEKTFLVSISSPSTHLYQN